MGSREEFFSAVKLIGEKKIKPVVDSVLNGLGEAEKGFQLLKEGGQFGKVRLGFLRLPKPKLTSTTCRSQSRLPKTKSPRCRPPLEQDLVHIVTGPALELGSDYSQPESVNAINLCTI